jgi:hypothetical protein
MTLSKVVRKGSYQGVTQWGINTSSEITPSRATARKWAELENARNPMNHVANGLSPEHGRLTRAELFAAIQSLNWLYGRNAPLPSLKPRMRKSESGGYYAKAFCGTPSCSRRQKSSGT